MRLSLDLTPRAAEVGLSLEEALLDSVRGGEEGMIRLWVAERSVVIGRSQRLCDEVDWSEAERLGIPVLRRISGGGAVFHYPGNLNAAVVVRTGSAFAEVRQTFLQFGGALACGLEALGVPIDVEENALLIGGRKVSGAAQARRGGALLYHCTLLALADVIPMGSVLRAMRDDYAPHGVPSRPRPTTTLSEELGRRLTLDETADAVLEGLARIVPRPWRREEPGCAVSERAEVLSKERYSQWKWNALR